MKHCQTLTDYKDSFSKCMDLLTKLYCSPEALSLKPSHIHIFSVRINSVPLDIIHKRLMEKMNELREDVCSPLPSTLMLGS